MKKIYKNIAKNTLEEIVLEDGFFVLNFQNETSESQYFEKEIDNTFIQLHFCLKGNCKFHFNNSTYVFNVLDKHSIILYNPNQKLPINLEIRPKTSIVSVIISIEKFHLLFSKDAGFIHFLSEGNKEKKYYDDLLIATDTLVVLQQIINTKINTSIKDLYIKGKVYELLSLHFNKKEDTAEEYCPFLIDDLYVKKIRQAKDIIILRMTEPPSLQELANEIGLNVKKLKEGFKQIYGDTVYGFLFNYKMEQASKLLKSNKFNVNEVGAMVGYSTASHFITAFKKKYGTTPKKYTTNSQNN